MPDPVSGWHVGRAWDGCDIEDACPCPQEPCGLVDPAKTDPSCPEHAPADRSMRQGHRADQCPGTRDPAPSRRVPPARVNAGRYDVTCLPDGHPEAPMFTLTVEHHGNGRWAVRHDTLSLDAGGEEHPLPELVGKHGEEWLARHLFPLDEALRIARRTAPKIVVAGMTTADVLARHTPREAR